MRKLILLFCVGTLFAQQAVAEPRCTLKPGNDIHCANCVTLEQFAFYRASAIYPSRNHQQRSIQVIGNNGSSVFVTKRVAWNEANLSVRLGRLGEFGVNLPYPNLNEAQVTAYDINHKLKGALPNGGRFEYGALNAKCKQIEKDQEAKKKRENEARRAFYESIAGRGYRPSSAEIAFLTGQTSSLYIRGERGDPPPCHGINGNSGTRCYRY